MNIIEQEDLIKGLPDQALFQQAQNPNSQVPQFLVVSEIQRRTDMRKRFEAAEAQPQATVTDQILMEGLGAPQPAPPPQGSMPPAGMPAPPSPQLPLEGSSPLMGQGMAAGVFLVLIRVVFCRGKRLYHFKRSIHWAGSGHTGRLGLCRT